MEELARNQFQLNIREALTNMLKDPEIAGSTGVAKFSKKQKNVFTKVFFRNGKIYSVYSTEITHDFVTRLFQSGDITGSHLSLIKNRFDSNLRDPEIPQFLIERHMVPEDIMEVVKRDFFLDTFSKILDWNEVSADWIANEETDDFIIVSAEYDKVIQLIDNRKQFLIDVANTFGTSVEELSSLRFVQKKQFDLDETTPLIVHQVSSLADGEGDINDVSNHFGLTNFRTIQTVYELWDEDKIKVYINGIEIAAKEKPAPQNDTPTKKETTPPTENTKIVTEEVVKGTITAGYNKSKTNNNLNNSEKTITPIPEIILIDTIEENIPPTVNEEPKNVEPEINITKKQEQITPIAKPQPTKGLILPTINQKDGEEIGKISNKLTSKSNLSPQALKRFENLKKRTAEILDNFDEKNILEENAKEETLTPHIEETPIAEEENVFIEDEETNEVIEEISHENETQSGQIKNSEIIKNTQIVKDEEETNKLEDSINQLEQVTKETVMSGTPDFDFDSIISDIKTKMDEKNKHITELENAIAFDEKEKENIENNIRYKKEKLEKALAERQTALEKIRSLS